MGYKDGEGEDLEEFNSYPKIRDTIDAIRKMESADGRLTQHREITSGEQKGSKAYGQYGFTPVGFIDAARTMGKRTKDEELKALGDLDPEVNQVEANDVTEALIKTRPDIEQKLIRDLASRLLLRQRGDVERAALQFEGNPYGAYREQDPSEKDDRIRRYNALKALDEKQKERMYEEQKKKSAPVKIKTMK